MIAEKHKEFLTKVIKLAHEYDIERIEGELQYEDKNVFIFNRRVKFHWGIGRHGDAAPLHIESTEHDWIQL